MSGPYINGARRQRIWLMGGRHGGSEKIRKRGDSLRRVVERAQRTSAGRRMARRHRAGRPGSLAGGTGSGERHSRRGRGEKVEGAEGR